jgi:hypothetical protein
MATPGNNSEDRPSNGGGRSRRGVAKSGGGQGKGAQPRGGGGRGSGGKKPEPEDPIAVLRTRLAKVLGRLPETQRNVLEYRMGLIDGHPHNLSDTAKTLGLTMHEAKQIEQRAFEHIREAIPIQHLQKFLGPS